MKTIPQARKIVIEHNVKTTTGYPLPTTIIDGKEWGDDFENLCDPQIDTPSTSENLEGVDPQGGQRCTFDQTFIRTHKSDTEILTQY